MKKTICLDFDGVLHSYTTNWKSADVIPDPPVAGALEFCKSLIANNWLVYIQSVRACSVGGRLAMEAWLTEHGFPSDVILTAEKPKAWVYLDDRAWLFRGSFPRLSDIERFTTWNRPEIRDMLLPTLIATVGLPRSGKSTWAKGQGYPIVNPDSVRLALHGQRFLPEAEPMVWTLAKYMAESLFLAGHRTVILDATNTTKKRRDEWLSKKWELQFHVIETPADECIRRAQSTNDPDIVPIIQSMAAKYEAP